MTRWVSFDCLLTLIPKRQFYRGIAQLEERLLWEQEALGSRPSTSTTEARESLVLVSYATAQKEKQISKISRKALPTTKN